MLFIQKVREMILRFTDTQKIETHEGTIWDYPIGKDIGISYQELHQRGPDKGQYLNTVCHEIYFIIAGTATFFIKDIEFKVEKNDVVIVPENTPHYIETTGLKYITITRPDWFEEQYRLAD